MSGTVELGLSARPILLALVGKIDALPGEESTLAMVGDGSLRIRETGELFLNRGSDSADVGSLEAGDWFLAVAVFDGSSSQIHLIKNDETTWASATVDDGGGSPTSIADLFVGGWDGNRVHATFVSDVPADLNAYREGLARLYNFPSLASQTGMAATTADIDGWKVLHDGSADYVLSVAMRIEEPGPTSATLLEILNDAENGGLRWEWAKADSELTVTFIGSAGTFAETFDLSTYADDVMVVELRFEEATGGSAALFVNGDSQGTFTPTGFAYSAVQQNPLRIGTDRGWVLCELKLTEGTALNNTELSTKWAA